MDILFRQFVELILTQLIAKLNKKPFSRNVLILSNINVIKDNNTSTNAIKHVKKYYNVVINVKKYVMKNVNHVNKSVENKGHVDIKVNVLNCVLNHAHLAQN